MLDAEANTKRPLPPPRAAERFQARMSVCGSLLCPQSTFQGVKSGLDSSGSENPVPKTDESEQAHSEVLQGVPDDCSESSGDWSVEECDPDHPLIIAVGKLGAQGYPHSWQISVHLLVQLMKHWASLAKRLKAPPRQVVVIRKKPIQITDSDSANSSSATLPKALPRKFVSILKQRFR